MKQKPCPLCGKPGTIWKTLLACCSSPSCTLNSFFGETKEWNRLPRRDPLQKQKDAVVRAAEHMDRFADWSIMTRSGQTAIDHLRLAVTALQSARSRHAH